MLEHSHQFAKPYSNILYFHQHKFNFALWFCWLFSSCFAVTSWFQSQKCMNILNNYHHQKQGQI